MRKFIKMVFLSAATILAAGCATEPGTGPVVPPTAENVDVILRLRTPGGFAPPSSTRALSYEAENKIETIHVMAFDQTTGVLTVVKKGLVESSETTGDYTGGYSGTGEFTVTLPAGEAGDEYTLAVFANLGDDTAFDAMTAGITEGTSDYDDVMAALEIAVDGKLYASGGTVPMWGEETDVELIPGSLNVEVELTRAVARIDVGVGVAERDLEGDGDLWTWSGKTALDVDIPFELVSVQVYNPNDAIAVMPDPAAATGAPTVPAGAAAITTPWMYTAVTNKLYSSREIYVPEADVKMGATSPGGTKHTGRMAIVIGGVYNNSGTTTYYRADFVKEGDLINVLRNHLYQFSIASVSGPGYPDADAAFAGESINMTINVIDWSETDMDVMEWVGQKFFKFSERPVEFGATGGEKTVTFKTNITTGFTMKLGGTTITAPANATPAEHTSANFTYSLKLDGTSDGVNTYSLKITAARNFGSSAAGKSDNWTIAAGGLITAPFEVTQGAEQFYISIEGGSTFHVAAAGVSSPGYLAEILSSETLTASISYPGAASLEEWLGVTVGTDVNGMKSIRLTAAELNYGDPRDGFDGFVNRRATLSLKTSDNSHTLVYTVIQSIPEMEFHNITVNAPAVAAQGMAMANPDEAPEGAPVRLLASPAAGFAFKSWSVTKDDGNGGQETFPLGEQATKNPADFSMPGADVTVTPVFEASDYFSVTLNSPAAEQGSATITPTEATSGILPGVWVVATATPATGWVFAGWDDQGSKTGLTADQLKEAEIRFQMPQDNVMLTPKFAKLYKATLNTVTGFTIANGTNGSEAITNGVPAGTLVTYTATQTDVTYRWKGFSTMPAVTDTDSDPLTITFAMPVNGITVTPASTLLSLTITGSATWTAAEFDAKQITVSSNVKWNAMMAGHTHHFTLTNYADRGTAGDAQSESYFTIAPKAPNNTVDERSVTVTVTGVEGGTATVKQIAFTQPAAAPFLNDPADQTWTAAQSEVRKIDVVSNVPWSATISNGSGFVFTDSSGTPISPPATGVVGGSFWVKPTNGANSRGDVTYEAEVTISGTDVAHPVTAQKVNLLQQPVSPKTLSVVGGSPGLTLSWAYNATGEKTVTVNSNVAWTVSVSGSGYELRETPGGANKTSVSGSGNGTFIVYRGSSNSASSPVTAVYNVSALWGGIDPVTVTATQAGSPDGEIGFDDDTDVIGDWDDDDMNHEL